MHILRIARKQTRVSMATTDEVEAGLKSEAERRGTTVSALLNDLSQGLIGSVEGKPNTPLESMARSIFSGTRSALADGRVSPYELERLTDSTVEYLAALRKRA